MTLINFNVAETLSSFRCMANMREAKTSPFQVADDGPDPPQREGGPTEENVRTSIKSQRMHHVKVACGSFVGLGSAGDPQSWFFQRSLFFSESYQGCSPIFLLDLSAGHTNKVGWCFVEACAVSSYMCLSRLPDAETGVDDEPRVCCTSCLSVCGFS